VEGSGTMAGGATPNLPPHCPSGIVDGMGKAKV
jgi:hypothetical protein